MQGNVHLHVSGEGVGALVEEVPDDGLVLVLAGPHQGGPASVILDIDVSPGQLVGAQDDVTALEMTILSRQVEGGHPIITLQLNLRSGSDKVADNVWKTLEKDTLGMSLKYNLKVLHCKLLSSEVSHCCHQRHQCRHQLASECEQ